MKHRLARLSVLGACIALAVSLVITTSAGASNIDDKRAQAQELQRQIDANGEQISMLAERYDGARIRLDDAQRNIDRVTAELTEARLRTSQLRTVVASRGVALYIGAGTESPLSFADLTDIGEAGSRSSYAAAASDRDNQLLDQLRASTEDLGLAETRLEAARTAAQHEIATLDTQRRKVEEANARQTQLLSQVQGEIATLIEEERARQAAEEKARSDAEFRRLSLAARERSRLQVTNDAAPSAVGVDPSQVPVPDAPAPSPGAAAAVAYAKAQLGKPYRYAAAGPDEFDCSGLTMMAWAQAGVSMPHYSAAQGAMFPRVPNDQLSPGDLVIYYPDEHHVAIYAGDGMTIAATHTGDFVRLQPVFRSGFQYAVRPG
jgi:cell wall-associated NlpC family hydrolase